MAPMFTIEFDTTALIAALDRLGPVAEKHLKEAAKVTADRIVQEARGRVARATGQTAAGIHAEESHDGKGYVVFVAEPSERWQHLGIGLEFGTAHMKARPFLLTSATLEEGAHRRRIEEAIQAAIEEVGLGS